MKQQLVIEFASLGYTLTFGENRNGKPTASCRRTGGSLRVKPLLHYYYSTEDQMMQSVNAALTNLKTNLKSREEMKNRKKEVRANMVNPFSVGDILYNSWGYEQTNIDFYQIIEVGKKSVKIMRIKSKYEGDCGFMSNYVSPDKDNFYGEPKTKILQVSSNGIIHIHSRHGWMSRWDMEKITESHYA